MSTPQNPLDQLNSSVDQLTKDLSAKFSSISAEIAALQAAGGATPDQLAAINAKIQALDQTVTTFSA